MRLRSTSSYSTARTSGGVAPTGASAALPLALQLSMKMLADVTRVVRKGFDFRASEACVESCLMSVQRSTPPVHAPTRLYVPARHAHRSHRRESRRDGECCFGALSENE